LCRALTRDAGGIIVTPLPGATPTKPGSATLPFFGVEPVVVDAQSGLVLTGASAASISVR
jgi:acetyl-CoA synthetase